jgi:hypothetical protein
LKEHQNPHEETLGFFWLKMDSEDEYIPVGSGAMGESGDIMPRHDWQLYNSKNLEEVRKICQSADFSKPRFFAGLEIPSICALVNGVSYGRFWGSGINDFDAAADILIECGFDINSTVKPAKDNADWYKVGSFPEMNLASFVICDVNFRTDFFIKYLMKKGVKPNMAHIVQAFGSEEKMRERISWDLESESLLLTAV